MATKAKPRTGKKNKAENKPEEHPGHWKDCPKCRKSFETEIYVFYGTNEFNFEKLENPAAYLPTKCAKCGVVISLGYDGYSTKGGEYWCEECTHKEMESTRTKR